MMHRVRPTPKQVLDAAARLRMLDHELPDGRATSIVLSSGYGTKRRYQTLSDIRCLIDHALGDEDNNTGFDAA